MRTMLRCWSTGAENISSMSLCGRMRKANRRSRAAVHDKAITGPLGVTARCNCARCPTLRMMISRSSNNSSIHDLVYEKLAVDGPRLVPPSTKQRREGAPVVVSRAHLFFLDVLRRAGTSGELHPDSAHLPLQGS